MTEIKNSTSGIGNPYWYEWTVGLDQTINMLNPDNNIKSITLQAPDLQGLDDVVIKYHDGSIECIQVKHTREGDMLSFSDIISRKNDQSYISKFAKDWLRLTQDVHVKKVILYTNRIINDTPNNRNGLYRPGLDSFLKKFNKQIHKVEKISDIIFPKEWEKAWKRFLEELDILESNEQKLDFLRVLEIQASQPDLLELKRFAINKIEATLQSNVRVSEALFDKLVVALFTWTTTHRKNEEISLEDLYEALSLEFDDFKGIVSLPTTEPFIESRVKFCEDLEREILNTDKKVMFLSGEAGSGKTNVSSFLVNKVNSIISLKYYTFKPLNIKSNYLSADKGGSNPRTLWGDLLLQLKNRLKGQLSKYNVPMSIEFIDSIDQLRKEVIRLSEIMSELSGKKTIILIDGIDHAARSGQDSSFLNTLLPPELLSDKVCFVIIGQPINSHNNYPTWISDSSVLKIEMPPVTLEDVESLCETSKIILNDTERCSLANFIHHHTKGNILLSIFLIHESQKYANLSEFESILQKQNISQGLNLYYEYIWKSAISELGDTFEYLEKILAGLFSLINKGIHFEDLEIIFPDLGLETLKWKNILDKLFPLIIEHEGVYTVFHNDFRMYLQKILEQDPSIVKQVSSYLADFLLERCKDIPLKHEHIFNLLIKAQRQNELFKLMNPEYIRDAIKYSRSLEELEEQILFCLDFINENFNIDNLFKLSLSISTLNQFLQSNQWADINYVPSFEYIELTDTEKYYFPIENLSINDVLEILNDIYYLINNEEESRGHNLINKWFGTLNPLELVKVLNVPIIVEKQLNEALEETLWKFGYLNAYFNKDIQIKDSSDKDGKIILELYSKGSLNYLAEAKRDDILEKIDKMPIMYKKDYESFLVDALKQKYTEDVLLTLIKKKNYEKYNLYTLLEIYFWALKLDFVEEFQLVKSIIVETELDLFKGEKYSDQSFKPILLLVIVKSYENEEYETIVEDFKKLQLSRSEAQLDVYLNYIQAAYYIGKIYKMINSQQVKYTNEFEKHLVNILNSNNLTNTLSHFDILSSSTWILNHFKEVVDLIPREFENKLIDVLKKHLENPNNILYLESIWSILQEYGEKEVLSELYSYWMDNEGKVWGEEFSELHRLANLFLTLSEGVIDSSKILASKNILSSKFLGYIGRKDYSLFNLLEWFNSVSDQDPSIWKTQGIELLNINNIASELGDNRAGTYLESAISKAAINCGPNESNKFLNLEYKYNPDWMRTIFDGIISKMEDHIFTDDECDFLIEAAKRVFSYNESFENQSFYNLNCIYLSDVRDAIIASKIREDNITYIDKMKKQYSFLFKLPKISRDAYKIESRFFNDKESTLKLKSRIDVPQILDLIKKNHFEKNQYIDFNELLSDIKKIEPLLSRKNAKAFYNSIYHLICTRDNTPWLYDGVDTIYKHILYSIDIEYKKQILSNIIQRFRKPNQLLDSKIYALASDIESYIIAHCKELPFEKKKTFLNELISLHKLWITGNYTVPFKIKYEINNEGNSINNWCDFFSGL